MLLKIETTSFPYMEIMSHTCYSLTNQKLYSFSLCYQIQLLGTLLEFYSIYFGSKQNNAYKFTCQMHKVRENGCQAANGLTQKNHVTVGLKIVLSVHISIQRGKRTWTTTLQSIMLLKIRSLVQCALYAWRNFQVFNHLNNIRDGNTEHRPKLEPNPAKAWKKY